MSRLKHAVEYFFSDQHKIERKSHSKSIHPSNDVTSAEPLDASRRVVDELMSDLVGRVAQLAVDGSTCSLILRVCVYLVLLPLTSLDCLYLFEKRNEFAFNFLVGQIS